MILNLRPFLARYLAPVFVALSFALVCSAGASAQASRVGATLEGTVGDSSSALIPQAIDYIPQH